MDSISVYGGVHLQGRVKIQGSKNAVLPILAATLLTKGENFIYNCPKISDVYAMQQLLRSIGCTIKMRSDCMMIQTENVSKQRMPAEAVKEMRSSVCMLGALLSRNGEMVMEYPGGCVIGTRPIDLHLQALEQMGACFEERQGLICGKVKHGFHGAKICFPKVSVGATENVVLAAVLAKGMTYVHGAAREPEVEALCEYLCACGADIKGAGTDTLVIQGVEELKATSYRIPTDRIVAGTYLFAVLATGGCVLLEDAPYNHMEAVFQLAREMGADIQFSGEGVYVQAPCELKAVEHIRTQEYPGFPTDLQSAALAASIKAHGMCRIEETIFENRFHIVEPLIEMGADIQVIDARNIVVYGPASLKGRAVEAKELRGGAALVTAGLAASGNTTITGCRYIARGYENICKDLRELGARIVSV